MTYKTILACLSDPGTAPQVLDLAFRVGAAQGAHVECLHIRTDVAAAVPLVGEGMSGAMVEEMLAAAEKQSEQRAALIRGQFDQACLTHSARGVALPPAPDELTAHWREEVGREEELVTRAGRAHDLVVMARPVGEGASPFVLNAVLLESGRPLLLAPPTAPSELGKTVGLLWNGSAEAARVLSSALPLLHRAETVHVLSAREQGTSGPAEVIDYLAWHGVAATSHSFAPGGSVPETLLGEAGRLGIDLLVMGAYTHSRLRQLILGGVTRHVLQNAAIPVLLSH